MVWLYFILLTSPANFASAAPCESEFVRLSTGLAHRDRKELLKRADTTRLGEPERRPKQINGNHRPIGIDNDIIESADPTAPLPFFLQDGKEGYRWYASGIYVFEADTIGDILRGGQASRRIATKTYYPDGVTEAGGNYHTGSHIWDRLAVKVRLEDFRDYSVVHTAANPKQVKDMFGNDVNYRIVGYGGMMEQPFRLKGAASAGITERLPLVGKYNYTRSRHAFNLRMENGVEVWRSRGSMSHSRPGIDGHWLTDEHQHGYGGRPLMDANGFMRIHDGTPWFVYERVTEQKIIQHPDGRGEVLPWITEVVARRMKTPYELFRKGEKLPDGRAADEEIVLVSVKDKSGHPYPATDRHGMGFLFEGFNLAPDPVTINGKKYWVGVGSPGNYVEDYGVVLGYRRFKDGPIGPYQLATKANGDLENTVAEFAEKYRLTWTGRADLFFHRGKPWIIMHGVDIDNLPQGFPTKGWPKPEEFEYYFRNQYVVPVKFVERRGRPALRVVDPSI